MDGVTKEHRHVQQINCDRCHDGDRHRKELVPHRWPRLAPIEEIEQSRRRVISDVSARLFRPGSRQPGLSRLGFLPCCFCLHRSFCCFGCWRRFDCGQYLCCLNDGRRRRGSKRFGSHCCGRLGAYTFGSGCGRREIFAPSIQRERQQETDIEEVFEERHGDRITVEMINESLTPSWPYEFSRSVSCISATGLTAKSGRAPRIM